MPQQRCPRCLFELHPVAHNGYELDVCHNCHGFFVEHFEQKGTFGEDATVEAWVQQGLAKPKAGRLRCPSACGEMKVYDLSFEKLTLELDACPTCKGIWLDARESHQLNALLSDFKTKKETPPGGAWGYLAQLFTGIPIEEWNPVHKTPWVLFATMALCVAVFAFQLALALTLPESAEGFVKKWSVLPAAISEGQQMWGLLTYAFLHGGLLHIAGNLYFLYIFGDNIEDRCGRFGFAAIYVVTALAGGVAHYLSSAPDSEMPMLGASGAVSGFMGAYWVLFPKVKVWMVVFFIRFKCAIYWFFGIWIATQLLGIFSADQGVAWFAHGGGFLAGVLIGVVYRFSSKKPKEDPLLKRTHSPSPG